MKRPVKNNGEFHLRTKPSTIQIQVNSTEDLYRSAILDNCSGLSIIDAKLCKSLFPGIRLNTARRLRLQGIGENHSFGSISTSVFIDGKGDKIIELQVELHVVPNFEPGVCLGMDVIHNYDMDLLHSANTVRINSIGAEFWIDSKRRDHTHPTSVPVFAKSKTELLGMHHNAVEFTAKVKENIDYTFEPCFWTDSQDVPILTAPRGIIDSATSRVAISNVSDLPRTLEMNQLIGYAHPISFQSKCYNTNIPSPWTDSHAPEEMSQHHSHHAAMPDSSDREPEPHQTGPSYKEFDVGRGADGRPYEEICRVLDECRDAFTFDGRPGVVKDIEVDILTTDDSKLPAQPPRRMSPEKSEVATDTIRQLLEWGVIEPSDSPVSHGVVLVKQNGKWRFCVDFWPTNDVTIPDRYPMQRIDMVFQSLSGKRLFSSADACKGYHQIMMNSKSKWKTAFVTKDGLFQYRSMPFGLRNAPAVFQRLMDKMLGSMRYQSALVYIDDIVIFSDSVKEHAQHIRQVLQAAISIGLKLSPNKCHFGYTELQLLGRVISQEGLRIDQDRARPIKDIAPPKNYEELYHILGLFNSYRMFVYGYAKLASPLTSLTKGIKFKDEHGNPSPAWRKKPVPWSTEAQESLNTLKQRLSTAPTLAYPRWQEPFIVYIDASKDAFAVALHQQFSVESPKASANVSMEATLLEEWGRETREDKLWQDIVENVKDNDNYSLQDGVLQVRLKDNLIRTCLPQSQIANALHDIHDAFGHPGLERSWTLFKQQFFRPGAYDLLKQYIDHCPTCLQAKTSRKGKQASLPELELEPTAFHTVAMDFITGLPPVGGHDAVLLLVDVFTKYVILIPTVSKYSAMSVAKDLFQHVVRRGFLPKRIISDNDKVFIGTMWKELSKLMNIRLSFTSPYHPQSDPAERYNQTFETMIRCLCLDDPQSWLRMLPWCEMALNSLKSSVTLFSPHELLYNNVCSPLQRLVNQTRSESSDSANSLLEKAKSRLKRAYENIVAAHKLSKTRYDSKHVPIQPLQVGDFVFIRTDIRPIRSLKKTKMSCAKVGPFRVTGVEKRSATLELPPDYKIIPRFSIQHLERAPNPKDDPYRRNFRPTPVIDVDEDPEEPQYEIEKLIGRRKYGRNKLLQYKVLWKGYPEEDSTWELAERLKQDGNKNLIEEYDKTQLGGSHILFQGEQYAVSETSVSPNIHSNSVERPVYFDSRVTRSYEKNYQALELELACLSWAILRCQVYLEGRPFEVITDHANLRTVLFSSTDALYSAQVHKQRAVLQTWLPNMSIRYRPGSTHKNVDALSRLAQPSSTPNTS